MLEAILILSAAIILVILFWPRPDPYVRDIVSTRNGQLWWRDCEPY